MKFANPALISVQCSLDGLGLSLPVQVTTTAAHRFRCLLEHDRSAINSEFDDGRTPLLVAAQYGRITAVRCLLEMKADVMHKRRELTAMHMAAQYGHRDVLDLLLQHTNDMDVDFTHAASNTPLMLAVRYGHAEVVQLMLEKGANINRGDRSGWHSLHRAANAGHTDLVEILLDKVRPRGMRAAAIAMPTPCSSGSSPRLRPLHQIAESPSPRPLALLTSAIPVRDRKPKSS